MPDDFNPFEPWRPRSERDDSPGRVPDDDLLRPWRTARRERDEEEAEPEWYRQPRAPEPAWTPSVEKPRGAGAGFVWLTILLFFASLIVWAVNGGGHITRVASAGLALWIALLFAMVVGRKREWRWYSRWGALAGGVVIVVVCWLFIPTAGGVNLWTAESVLARLRDLTPADTNGYAALAPERQAVAREFQRFRNDLRTAEWRWFDRTLNQEIAQAGADPDPVAALARLRKARTSFSPTDYQMQQLLARLQQARQRVLTAVLEKNEAECGDLMRKKQFVTVAARARKIQTDLAGEARELQLEGDLNTRVRVLRDHNFRLHLEDARVTLENLHREEKYAAVATEAKRLTAELSPEARALGQEAAIKERLLSVRQRALTRLVSAANAELNRLVEKGDFDQVPERARKYHEELGPENAALNDFMNLSAAFLTVRETALKQRAERARKSLEELLTKKDYAAVTARAGDLVKELDVEGQAIGKTDWREGITEIRRKALHARLEVARQQVQEQLKNKRYAAMGETGEKTYSELGLEAEAVGLRGEVEKFRNVCRFYARLAKDAGEDGK